ncbi:hypothetical protein TNIN_360011 [Trichonephila inaurata madagascariensis]|uniref:Uncharacterized protein n=1 Tax=Trichonephila inaurata madagascariensis TaxID=2747483 RepID=A0A8X6WMW7_9ARAC|nr:hypothetical protein TNIN_360011 [Trichonephila inaurata madagascariensis]
MATIPQLQLSRGNDTQRLTLTQWDHGVHLIGLLFHFPSFSASSTYLVRAKREGSSWLSRPKRRRSKGEESPQKKTVNKRDDCRSQSAENCERVGCGRSIVKYLQ